MLQGRVALVTGSGSGIGKAMVLAFAREGADIVVTDINEAAASEVAQLIIKETGRKAIAIKADVSNAAQVDSMIGSTISQLGSIDILVNNAGIGQEFVPTIEQSIEKWDAVISTHLRGAYLCSRRAGQWMVKQKKGVITNISSIVGFGGYPQRTSYGPAKAGIINLTEALAVEWAPFNIRVNAIAPGYVVTPLIAKKIKDGTLNMDAINKHTPLGRSAYPEEIADAAVFLASDKASFITGVTLPVDGGWLANRYL